MYHANSTVTIEIVPQTFLTCDPLMTFRKDKNKEKTKEILVHKRHNNLFFKKGHLINWFYWGKMCYV